VVLVACADLQDAGDPIVIGFLPRVHRFIAGFLPLDTGVICDIDEAFTEVFYSIDYATERPVMLA
jgi:hypothetical protein